MTDHVGPVPQEAKKVQNLETSLQKADLQDPRSKAATDARAALQAELDGINNSAAVKRDPDYVNRLQRKVAENDVQGTGTGDGKAHKTALTKNAENKLEILPDQIVRADESDASIRRAQGLPVTMSNEQADKALNKPLTEAQQLEAERQNFNLPKGTPKNVIKEYESDKMGVLEKLYELACAKGDINLPRVKGVAGASAALDQHLNEINKHGPAFTKRIYDSLPPQFKAAIQIDPTGKLSTNQKDWDKKMEDIRPH
jgi:hypothetical protein